jgi:prevent-host-death family protein
MDNLIGLKQLREQTEDYVDAVKKGQSFIVMRRSKPIFKITPVENEAWEEVVDFTAIKKGGVDIEDILKRI